MRTETLAASEITGTRTPAVLLRGLTKKFGAVTAVNRLDLRIEQGEVVAFLGPNGAGKTTTIDMMLGLAQPTAGSVEVYGHDPDRGHRPGPDRGRDADRRPAQGRHRRRDRAG